MHKQVTVVEMPRGKLTTEQQALGKEIEDLWASRELGNDYYYYPFSADYDAEEYPVIADCIKANQLEGKVLLHYSW